MFALLGISSRYPDSQTSLYMTDRPSSLSTGAFGTGILVHQEPEFLELQPSVGRRSFATMFAEIGLWHGIFAGRAGR